MIQDNSSMDRPIARPGGLSRRQWVAIGLVAAAALVIAVLSSSAI